MDKEKLLLELLETISKTDTWLSLDNLYSLLPEEMVNNLEKNIFDRNKIRYAKLAPSMSEEELTEAINKEVMSDLVFIIEKSEEEFYIKEFAKTSLTCLPINTSVIEIDTALQMLKEVISAHLEYGLFYSNKKLTAIQIEEELRDSIRKIEENSKSY